MRAFSFLTISALAVFIGACSPSTQNDLQRIDSHDIYRNRNSSAPAQLDKFVYSNLEAGTFQQPIDHTGEQTKSTFAQRYWVDSNFATANDAPVIYHICGEGDVDRAYFLNDNAKAWAKSLGARIVFLEHRYYGQSQPPQSPQERKYQYLTLPNIIEDLANFQKQISAERHWTGPWIAIGGSYSGTLSAIYRLLHPELVVGALASSAPIFSGVGSTTNSDYMGQDGDPWTYQACTTFGFWLAGGYSLYLPGRELCNQNFQGAPYFDANTYNEQFAKPFYSVGANSASHILFTYGGDDVWTQIGLNYASQITNPNVEVVTIRGAGHHEDLNLPTPYDSDEIKAARSKFLQLAKTWLQGR